MKRVTQQLQNDKKWNGINRFLCCFVSDDGSRPGQGKNLKKESIMGRLECYAALPKKSSEKYNNIDLKCDSGLIYRFTIDRTDNRNENVDVEKEQQND